MKKPLILSLLILLGFSAFAQLPSVSSFTTTTLPDCYGNGGAVRVVLSVPPPQGHVIDIDLPYSSRTITNNGMTADFTGLNNVHPSSAHAYTNISLYDGAVNLNIGLGYINVSNALWGNYLYTANSCGCGQAVFNISVSGGVPPYSAIYWPKNFGGPTKTVTLPGAICPGEYEGNLKDSRGCPVYRTLLTSVASTIGEFKITHNGNYELSNTSVTLCTGDSLLIDTTYYKAAGTYKDTIIGTAGCDTIRTYVLSYDTIFTINQNVQVCKGGTYTFRDGDTSSIPITDTSLVLATGACDTLIYSTLSLTPDVPEFRTVRHCPGTAFTFPDGDTSSFTHTDTSWLSGVGGCDSIIITDLQVSSQFTFTRDTSICYGTIFTFPDGDTATISRVDTSTFALGSACDSVIITTLTVNHPSFVQLKDTICEGAVYTFVDGDTSTINRTDTATFVNAKGCDSLYIVDLFVNSSPWNYATATVCSDSIYQFPDGSTSSVPVTDTSYLTAATGCDSVIVTTLSHNPTFHQKNSVKLNYITTSTANHTSSYIGYMNDGFLTGGFSGAYDVNFPIHIYPGLHSKGSQDIFTGDYYASVVSGMGSGSYDAPSQVHATKGPPYAQYFFGDFNAVMNFDLSYVSTNYITPKGVRDIYLYKTDFITNTVVDIGGNNVTCTLIKSDIDDKGNMYVVGSFNGKVDFDPGVGKNEITPAAFVSHFVARYLADGSLDWVREIFASSGVNIYQLNVNDKKEVMISGKFTGTMDLDLGPTQQIVNTQGLETGYVIVLDSNGLTKQAFDLKTTAYSTVRTGLLTDENIVIAVENQNQGSTDLDPGSGSNLITSNGTYLVSYNRSGRVEWVEKLSSIPNFGAKMVADTAGVIYFNYPGGIQVRSKYGELLMKRTSFGASFATFDLISASQIAVGGSYFGSVDLNPEAGVNMKYSFYNSHYVNIFGITKDLSNEKVICEGSSYTFPNGDTSSVTGYHTSKLTTTNGCDSSITIHLIVEPKNSYAYENFCQGTIFTFPDGDTTTITRTDTSAYTSTHGCSNQIITVATMDQVIQTVKHDTICQGKTFTFSDGDVSQVSITDTSAFVHSTCDSVIITHLFVTPPPEILIIDTICQGGVYTLPDGSTFKAQQPRIDTTRVLNSGSGCLEDRITDVEVTFPDTGVVQDTICAGNLYQFPDGDTATVSKIDTSRYLSTANCDTLLITQLYVEPMVSHFKVDSICQGRPYTFLSGRTSKVRVTDTSRIYVNGCLTQYVTQLNITPPPFRAFYDTICKGTVKTFWDGDTATVNKTDTSLVTVLGGCQENYVTQLYVISNQPLVVHDSLCAGSVYRFVDGDTSSRSIIDTAIISKFGCSQQVITHFTSLPPDVSQVKDTICQGTTHTFPDGDTATVDRMDTSFVSINGCLEWIYTDLTVELSSLTEHFDSICQGDVYTFPDGSIGTTKQTRQFFYSDTKGCDSVVKVDLYVTNVTASALQTGSNLTAIGNGSYQWIDCQTGLPVPQATQRVYTAQQNGQYAVVVTRFGCTDTSACYTITGVGWNEVQQESWIRLYPNPSSGVFILDYQGKERSYDYRITDASGKLIEEKKGVEEPQTQIDLSHLSNGTYYVTVESESELDQIKVLKEN